MGGVCAFIGFRDMPDVIAHVKAALASTAVDDEVSEYVADMANELLQDADPGAGFDAMVDELVDAAGAMLGEFIRDDEIKAIFQSTVTHFRGDVSGGSDANGAHEGGPNAGGPDTDDDITKVKEADLCLNLENIILAFAGKVLLRPTNLRLTKGNRYGVVGQNGAGKTTLLTRLAAGDITGWPSDLRCVFVRHEVLSSVATPILEFLEAKAVELKVAKSDAKPCLLAVGFTEELMRKTVTELSGGWRMRLAIATAMLQKADLLLLDEPTNHLDMKSQDILQKALIDYPGTLLIVSHFLSQVATNIVHFEDQILSIYEGKVCPFHQIPPPCFADCPPVITHTRYERLTLSFTCCKAVSPGSGRTNRTWCFRG